MSLALTNPYVIGDGGLPPPTAPSLRAFDAAQTWWIEPRAVEDNGALYTTGVSIDGVARIFKTTASGQTTASLGTVDPDDHNCPSVTLLDDGNLLCMWTNHGLDSVIRYKVTTTPGDITTFGAEQTISAGGSTTYTQAWEYDGDVHLIYRTGLVASGTWHYRRSTDGGSTWSAEKQLMATTNGGEYVASKLSGSTLLLHIHGHPSLSSDQNLRIGRIDLATGDVYTGLGGTASFNIYTGTGTLQSNDFDIAYTATDKTRLMDGLADASNPAMLFAEFTTEADATYKRVRWNGSSWDTTSIVSAGDVIHVTGSNFYFAGCAFDTVDSVYVAREDTGTWSLEHWEYAAGWSRASTIESRTDRKIWRPYKPLGADTVPIIAHAGWYQHHTSTPPHFAELMSLSVFQAGIERTWMLEEDWSGYVAADRPAWSDWPVQLASTGISEAPPIVNDATHGLSLDVSSLGGAAYIPALDLLMQDMYAELDFEGSDSALGIVWGWDDPDNFVQVLWREQGDVRILERISGVETTLDSNGASVSPGTLYRIFSRVVDGEMLCVLVNLSSLAPASFARASLTISGTKQPGFRIGSTGSVVIPRIAFQALDANGSTGNAPTSLRTGLLFDGLSNEVSWNDDHLSGVNAFTLSTWIRHDKASVSGDEDLFLVGVHASTTPILFWRDDPNGLSVIVNTSGGGSGALTFASTPAMQTEYHVALVVDAANGQLHGYIDGVEDANSPWSIPTGTFAAHVSEEYVIGRNRGGGGPFEGRMSDFRIYTAALSGANISSIAGDRTGQDGITTDLWLRLRMDDYADGLTATDTWPINDASGNRALKRVNTDQVFENL